MDRERLRTQLRTAALALFVGGAMAVAVAATVSPPTRAFVPLLGSGIVIYGAKLYLDRVTIPEFAWQAPLVAAVVIRLNPEVQTIYWTGGTLAMLSAVVVLSLPVLDRILDEE